MLQKIPRIHTFERHNDTGKLDKYYCLGDDLADFISAAHHSRLSAGETIPHSACPQSKRGQMTGNYSTSGSAGDDIVDVVPSFGLDSSMHGDNPDGFSESHLRRAGVCCGQTKIDNLPSRKRECSLACEHGTHEVLRRRHSRILACPPDLMLKHRTASQLHGQHGRHLTSAERKHSNSNFQAVNGHAVHCVHDELPRPPYDTTASSDHIKPVEQSEVASSGLATDQFAKSADDSDENSVPNARPADCTDSCHKDEGGHHASHVAAPQRWSRDTFSKDQDVFLSLLNAAANKGQREALERELLEFVNMY